MDSKKNTVIFLDPQIFFLQSFGGVSRIFAELWHYTKQVDHVKIICPLIFSNNMHLKEYGLAPAHSMLKNRNSLIKKIVYALQKRINYLWSMINLLTRKYDIVVTTYYGDYFKPFIGKKPFILTVFDMTHERFPQYFSGETRLMNQKKKLCFTANKIVAISQSTKNDILQFYPSINSSKIDVVHLGQSILTKEEYFLNWLPKSYVLFIGNRSHYKQFNVLLQSMIDVWKKYPHLSLVCAGGGPFTDKEKKEIELLGAENKIVQHNFEDAELYSIYKKATVFVFPSEYEGFGIPTLEAMTCGCPVILSKNSSLPEIGEDAADYFETNNVIELSEKIINLIENETYRNRLIQKGYMQAKKFSWEKMSKQYLGIINDILAK